MSLKDLGYKPRQSSVRLVFDDELRRAVEKARSEYFHQKAVEAQDGQGLGSELPELEAALEKAEMQADESAVEFTFRALGRRRIADLVAECPPTAEQLQQWKETARAAPLVAQGSPEFDYERFAPRLIAASLVSPETSEAEVLELWASPGGWSAAIWDELWKGAWGVNQEVSTRPT